MQVKKTEQSQNYRFKITHTLMSKAQVIKTLELYVKFL